MKSEKLAEVWMNLLAEFDGCFPRPGRERFRALLCGSLACERRPLVTEIVSALGIENHWRRSGSLRRIREVLLSPPLFGGRSVSFEPFELLCRTRA